LETLTRITGQYPVVPHTAQIHNKKAFPAPKLHAVELKLNICVEVGKPRKQRQKFRLQRGWLYNAKFFVGLMTRMKLKGIFGGMRL